MLGRTKLGLRRDYKQTTQELSLLNRELAAQMILLASQTGETGPLIQAVEALREANEYYSQGATPREKAVIRQTLADTLLTLGQANQDVEALSHAIDAYRDAITLASLLGDQNLRKALKRNYGLARNLLAQYGHDTALKGAA
ncbi:MAG: hypothetical protein ACSHXY_07745 [Alphaproteobacteria bacterium]